MLLSIALLTACGIPLVEPEDDVDSSEDELIEEVDIVGDVDLGLEIYETGGSSGVPCFACHTLDGANTVGPTFQGVADIAAERVEGMSAEEYLRQSVINPAAYVVVGYSNSMNQNYGSLLSDEEVEAVVAYMLTLTEE